MKSNSDKKSPEAIRELLQKRSMTQSALASVAGSSAPYISQLTTGRKAPSPEWIDTVTMALSLTPEESTTLYRAAAVDNGFKIDLDLTGKK